MRKRSLISGLACPVKDITQEKTFPKKSNTERISLLFSLTSSNRGSGKVYVIFFEIEGSRMVVSGMLKSDWLVILFLAARVRTCKSDPVVRDLKVFSFERIY